MYNAQAFAPYLTPFAKVKGKLPYHEIVITRSREPSDTARWHLAKCDNA